MHETLIFKPEHIDWAVDLGDSLTDFGIIGEATERPGYRIILTQANKYLSPKVPENIIIELKGRLIFKAEKLQPVRLDLGDLVSGFRCQDFISTGAY